MREARDQGNVDFLLDSLSHENVAIRRTAARFLGMVGDRRAVKPLVNVLGQPRLRMTGMKALARIGDPDAAPALYRIAVSAGGTDPGRVAMSSLAAVGDRRAIALIAAQLTKHDPSTQSRRHVRAWAARRLIELNGTEAIEVLEAARPLVPFWQRRQIMRALKGLKRPRRTGVLGRLSPRTRPRMTPRVAGLVILTLALIVLSVVFGSSVGLAILAVAVVAFMALVALAGFFQRK